MRGYHVAIEFSISLITLIEGLQQRKRIEVNTEISSTQRKQYDLMRPIFSFSFIRAMQNANLK